jgi:hypothetical protein
MCGSGGKDPQTLILLCTEQAEAGVDFPSTLLDGVSHLCLGLPILPLSLITTIHALMIAPDACYMHPNIPVYTGQLPPRSRVILEKLLVVQLLKKFPAFYVTRKIIAVLTKARHCPYSEPDESNPHPSILTN